MRSLLHLLATGLAHSVCSDFPSGSGESQFAGRFNIEDIDGEEAQRLFGLTPFAVPVDAPEHEKSLIEASNHILFE